MRRKILTILLVFTLCFSMATSAFAAAVCRPTAESQTVYACLKQQLVCWLFGCGCRSELDCWENCLPSDTLPEQPPLVELEPEQTPAQPAEPDPESPSPAEVPDDPVIVPSQPSEKPEKPAQSTVSSMERQVVELVNAERAVYGLPALQLDETLSSYARIKSQDLHDNRYFDHQSPTYGSPFDMMRSFGITYAYAGENIAMGYFRAEDVVAAWMNSSGHRANILSANFDRIGVGYVADGGYWTQWFLG